MSETSAQIRHESGLMHLFLAKPIAVRLCLAYRRQAYLLTPTSHWHQFLHDGT